MIKLISLDVDGTLLDHHGKLPQANLEAIRAASQRGLHVIINSGRPIIAMDELLDTLNLPDPVSTLNGTLIFERESCGNWRELISYPVPASAFAAIYHPVKTSQLTTFFLTRNYGYVHHVKSDPDYLAWFDALMERNAFSNYIRLKNSPLVDHTGLEQPPYKIMFCSNVIDEIRRAYRALETINYPGLCIEGSSSDTVDVHQANTSKQQAIIYICKRLGIQQKEVMALGDHESDFELIKWAGVGAIMANARIYLKSIAPLIAPSNDQNGVAEMIHTYAL
jgi:Cof subfamily protein (haloacid dehalogenase superfamily)